MRYVSPKIKSLRLKLFLCSIVFLSTYLLVFYAVLLLWFSRYDAPPKLSSVSLPYVVVHIDLKGSPPKLSYLESILPTLTHMDVNGLLVEYEDMFPYESVIANLSAANCYNKSELKQFLKSSVNSGFEIIPLVQTFGHMEHALKLEEFQHLRETPMFPDSICPSKSDSLYLIKNMLEQVINFHKDISPLKHIHVGCDEVFHFNKCKRCASRQLDKLDLFLSHVQSVRKIVSTLSPNTTVLIWDDMLRSNRQIKDFNTREFTNLEPVCWDYKPKVDVSHTQLYNYNRNFKNIWISSAFKGADGRIATFPNLEKRFRNHFNWLHLIMNYKFGGDSNVYQFKGIILTGWSRYSHLDPACELLPISMPSLLMNLALIKKFRDGVSDEDLKNDYNNFFSTHVETKLKQILRCDSIEIDEFDAKHCSFGDKKLYSVLEEIVEFNKDIETSLNDEDRGLSALEYYSKFNYSNMNHINYINKNWCEGRLNELDVIENKFVTKMNHYYEPGFVREYVEFKTYQAKKSIKSILNITENLSKVSTWKRRQ